MSDIMKDRIIAMLNKRIEGLSAENAQLRKAKKRLIQSCRKGVEREKVLEANAHEVYRARVDMLEAALQTVFEQEGYNG